jgi:alanyl-tRNA synthetase
MLALSSTVCHNRKLSEGNVSVTQPRPKFWSGNEIRETFLRFFEGKGHRRVRSSSLVPHGDPTLLFTNAGMNQFKDVFLGLEKRDYDKATSAQKCVRAGGKHNDLENVGFTKRHHTFFEMLGNFSFGDYFKEKAIPYAWELITSPDWFAIPKDKLYVTVFDGSFPGPTAAPDMERDEEARRLWLNQGVAADRIFELGAESNFWAMGDTGPCGPCSEIHYDMGPEAVDDPQTPRCTAGECAFPCDCGRYVEIWNLVFMQFNRDASGFTSLAKPSVDTGMGLERVAAVLQGVISNYDTDLFVPLMKRAAELCGVDFEREKKIEEGKTGAASLRVIADHARAATFLIADGVTPSNEGRGYVLRRIIRRAIDFGKNIGQEQSFFFGMVPTVVGLMETPYPELRESVTLIEKTIVAEEEKYRRLVKPAEQNLEKFASRFYRKAPPEVSEGVRFDSLLTLDANSTATVAHYAYGTLGLRPDAVQDWAAARNIKLDRGGFVIFESLLDKDREVARATWKGGAGKEAANPAFAKIAETHKTEPDFYFATSAKDARIEAIVTKNGPVAELKAGQSGEVVLDRTVIYAESGGQIADTGAFYDPSGTQVVAEVTGAYYPVARLVAHRVTAKDTLRVGDRVSVQADAERRSRIMRNHSGTHLVHAALRNILGTHVKQAGSLNAPDRLRFDFSHFAHVDTEELHDIEQQVNDEIRYNCQIETNVTSLEDALASGALAFFGDKYPESNVRVVTMPDSRSPRGFYSKELCGGTHVHRVGDIGVLKIVSEQSVAAGVRRIEAVTGIGALEHYQQRAQLLSQIASKLNVGEDALLATVEKLSETSKHLEKELEAQKRKGALGQLDDLTSRVQLVKGVKVIAAEVANVDREGLRQLVDSLRQKLGSGVVALGMPDDGKVALIAGVTKDLTSKVHAGKLIQQLAKQVGGSGGGRPDLAEAGGKDTSALKSALQSIPSLLEPLL